MCFFGKLKLSLSIEFLEEGLLLSNVIIVSQGFKGLFESVRRDLKLKVFMI
jgi:hypothetical protein